MSDGTRLNDRVLPILEEYLRHAGLFEIIAEHRRPHVLRWPPTFRKQSFWGFIWLLIFWSPEIGVIYMNNGTSGMTFALATPPITLIGYVLILLALFTVPVLSNRTRSIFAGPVSSDEPQAQVRQSLERIERVKLAMFGGLILGTPAVLAAIVGVHVAASAGATYFGLYMALTVLIVVLLNTSDEVLYCLYVTKGFVSMTWQVVREMLRHLPFIASVLVVIVLFSIFSSEFWEALGNLKTFNLVACIVLLTALPFVFALGSIKREAKETIKLDERENFLQEVIISPAQRNRFIKESLDEDRLTSEDWDEVKKELNWRPANKLCADIEPILRKHATRWLIVLLTSTVIFLFVAFFIYFSVLFHFLIEPRLLAKWIFDKPAAETIPYNLPIIGWLVNVPETIWPLAKVSLLLSAFIAMMSTVKVLSDGSVKQRFTEHLSAQARSWIALSCIYRNLISPGYQIWTNDVRHKGLANVAIVTRESSDVNAIKAACVDARAHFQKQRKLVLVTAFEHSAGETAYSYGMQANCWQMVFEQDFDAGDPVEIFRLAKPAPAGDPPLAEPAVEPVNGHYGATPRALELTQALQRIFVT